MVMTSTGVVAQGILSGEGGRRGGEASSSGRGQQQGAGAGSSGRDGERERERERDRGREDSGRHRSRSRDRGGRDGRDRERERERDGDRERGSERGRDQRRDRSRSRSRERSALQLGRGKEGAQGQGLPTLTSRSGVLQKHTFKSEQHRVMALVNTLTVGFANKLARRLPKHNGYKTFNTKAQLAQLHPACSGLAENEDGLTPEWIIYHELVQTSKPFLRQVSAAAGDAALD